MRYDRAARSYCERRASLPTRLIILSNVPGTFAKLCKDETAGNRQRKTRYGPGDETVPRGASRKKGNGNPEALNEGVRQVVFADAGRPISAALAGRGTVAGQ